MSFTKWEVRPLAEAVLGGGKGQGSEGGGEKGESEIVTAECRGATGPQSRPGALRALGHGHGGGASEPRPPAPPPPPPPPQLLRARPGESTFLCP